MEYTQWVGGYCLLLCCWCVLILVVMEYTQWVAAIPMLAAGIAAVLILVVMEYTQWVRLIAAIPMLAVLILVVMEYTQWGKETNCWSVN